MRAYPLGQFQAGITRLREKGGASPNSLYDLENGYVTADRSVLPRPGTRLDTILPAGTKGLASHQGKLHVFASSPVAMTDSNYVCHALIHPTDNTKQLSKVHFAVPFLGFLYVVAEFDNGNVYHYWLQDDTKWAANTVFAFGKSIVPTVQNGYTYTPSNKVTVPVWKAANSQAVNDVVQPSAYSGFTFKATAATGTPIMTGDLEPTWPTTDGATVVERRYVTSTSIVTPPPTTTPEPPASPPPSPSFGTILRYGFGNTKEK